MYTAPPPKFESDVEVPSVDMVSLMAQRLYDHFSLLNLNETDWLRCLEEFLSDARMNGDEEICVGEVSEKIYSILWDDKRIPRSGISDEAVKAVYREVAEWLVAEKIIEKMIAYESMIEEGIKQGRFQRFYKIRDVRVVKEDVDAFGANSDTEEIIEFIKKNYVVDMKGPVVGAGTRVEVRTLMPVKFPLPYPAMTEHHDGLMIKIPNRFLVVRLSKESYKTVLGDAMTKNEEEAIRTFILASDMLTFSGGGNGVSSVQLDVRGDLAELDDKDEIVRKFVPKKKSFIPPLLILQAQIGENSVTEYMTIQKKVMAKGTVLRGEVPMYEDLSAIPGFKKKLQLFVDSCKEFHATTGMLPDLVGHGNVLYTYKGSVYLVDINNISSEPDYLPVALMGFAKEIQFKLEDPRLSDEKRAEYEEAYKQTRQELTEELERKSKYAPFADVSIIERILGEFYIDNKDKVKEAFFRAIGLIDDLKISIFLHNISNLHGIELDILRHDFEEGSLTKEEYDQKKRALNADPLYAPLSDSYASSMNVRCYCFDDILRNKREGNSQWIAEYMTKIYGSLNSDGMGL